MDLLTANDRPGEYPGSYYADAAVLPAPKPCAEGEIVLLPTTLESDAGTVEPEVAGPESTCHHVTPHRPTRLAQIHVGRRVGPAELQ